MLYLETSTRVTVVIRIFFSISSESFIHIKIDFIALSLIDLLYTMVSRILDEATPIADAIEDAVDAMTSDCPSDTFACDANDITLASLGIAAGAASLIFVFFLMKKVRAFVPILSFGNFL